MRPPVIIGGGPAGSAAALALRQAGQPVTLIERSPGPADKVCADFLGASAIRIAESAGVSLASLGARPVTHARLIRRDAMTETRLPFRAAAVSRRVFDEALLRRCQETGVDLIRGETVRPPRADAEDFAIETQARGTIATGTLFLATGRPDPRAITPPISPPGTRSGLHGGPVINPRTGMTGYKMYLRQCPDQRDALAGRVELMFLPNGQAALQCVEADRAALCLLLRRPGPDDDWATILADTLAGCAHLRRRLEGSVPLLERPLVAREIPFGHLHRARVSDHDGLYRLGDQAAVLSSLIADGVSAAMRGGVRAAQAWLSGAGAADYHRRLRGMLWPRTRLVADYGPSAVPATDAAAAAPTAVPGAAPGAASGTAADSRLAARWNRLIA